MATQHLPNYLQTHRKRSALSQTEVAYLLGGKKGNKVCRYEKFTRVPSIYTALAYEVIFQKSFSELFPGLFEQIETQVIARAKQLQEKPSREETPLAIRRRQTLAAITWEDSN